MSPFAEFLTTLLSLLTLAGGVAFVLGAVWTIVLRRAVPRRLGAHLKQNGILYSFLIALGAVAATLYYSEVVGFIPCKLCWFGRIFMYPIAVVLGAALIKRDTHIADYGIVLAAFGIFVSVWHYLLQMTQSSVFSCGAESIGACATRYIFEFGYITFPMMELTAFVLIAVLLWQARAAGSGERR